MNLYIMRHGEAEQGVGVDSQRKLTLSGKKEAYLAGSWLHQVEPQLKTILVSPFVRARQTTEQVNLSVQTNHIDVVDCLIPEANAGDAHDFIDGHLAQTKEQSLLIVSHMPLVCYLVEALTGHCGPLFGTASIAHISYDPLKHHGQLINTHHIQESC